MRTRSGPRRRALVRTAVATALLTTAAVATAAADTASADPPARGTSPPNVAWAPCFQDIAAEYAAELPPEFGPPTFECAVVPVPLDHDEPRGGSIQISMVRLPALDPDPIGSLFLNPGGPGGSGVEFAVFGGPFLYSPDLRAQFDLIGFDPRGIARSTSVKCHGNAKQFFENFQAMIVAFPKTVAEAETWAAEEQQIADRCERNGNKVLGHMSTANVARDLDLLRAAVGDEQLTYAGYSYGSYLGQTYANMFPERVRAVIIDGVLDPIEWSTGTAATAHLPFSSRLESNVGAQATLEEFFRLCDAAPACALGGGSKTRYDALAAELLANEPVIVEIPVGPGETAPVPVYYGDLIGMSLGALYDSASWFFFAEQLAFLEAAVAGVESAPPPGFSVGGDGTLGYTAKRGFPRYMSFEGFPAVACADSDNPSSLGAWIDAAGEVSSDDYFRQLWTWASSPCLSFPATDDDRYVGPWTAETANPVLVASTQYDPATPVQGAHVANDLLPDSGLLLVDGWGHTTLGISGCASFYSERYLITQELPPDGLVCPQDFDPFELFAAGGPPPDGMQARALEARDRFLR